MAHIEDYVTLAQFTPGRARYALDQMAAKAAPGPLADAIAQALRAADALRTLEGRWATRKATPRARGRSVEADAALDRAVGVLHTHVQARLTLFGEAHPTGKQAADLLLRHLPGGAAAITHLAFEDELAAVDALVAALRGPDAAAAGALGAAPIVEVIAERADVLRAELATEAHETIDFGTVRAGRATLQRALTLVVAHAITTFGAPDQAEAFAATLAPLDRQMDRLRALRARRRPVADVDPSTGVEQEPPSGEG